MKIQKTRIKGLAAHFPTKLRFENHKKLCEDKLKKKKRADPPS